MVIKIGGVKMAVIYCFSSTGNSLYVAKRIGKKIDARVENMRGHHPICEDEVIGFVFPVYFWDIPYKVEEFIKSLEIKAKNPYIFAVATYGGMTIGVLGAVDKLLAAKGYHLNYGKGIKAVENYTVSFKVDDTQKVEDNLQKKLGIICTEIKNKSTAQFAKYTMINKLVRSTFPAKAKDCDKNLVVNNSCTGCGICSKVCPVGNINIVEKRPQFTHHCEHCLGCIHACPQQAINWKDKTVGKSQYRNKHISLQELITFEQKSTNKSE